MRSTDSILTARRARVLRSIARTGVAAAAVALIAGCMMFAKPPRDLDYSRTRTSAAGVYRGTIRPQADPIPQGRMQRWTFHLETASGTPVNDAQITIDGGMPQHGHGLPTQPVVTRHAGNGDHLVEGVKFTMSGWWVMQFHVHSAAGDDSLVFNLNL